jgi:hypothetical protein
MTVLYSANAFPALFPSPVVESEGCSSDESRLARGLSVWSGSEGCNSVEFLRGLTSTCFPAVADTDFLTSTTLGNGNACAICAFSSGGGEGEDG